MLIILVAILLAAAAKIENPWWIPGFLVISSVALSILVMAAVFMMLTRFRPHLQAAKEYADWLKDERRFTGQVVKHLEIREVPDTPAGLFASDATALRDLQLFSRIATHAVEISYLAGADEVLGGLRRLGFQANIYRSEYHKDAKPGESEHAAIWIGARVPPRVVVLAIKTVVKIWSHLCYMHLSEDGGEVPPDYIHDQTYFGGSTGTATRYGLKPWTREEIEAIPDNLEIAKFHELIRAKYASPISASVPSRTADASL